MKKKLSLSKLALFNGVTTTTHVCQILKPLLPPRNTSLGRGDGLNWSSMTFKGEDYRLIEGKSHDHPLSFKSTTWSKVM